MAYRYNVITGELDLVMDGGSLGAITQIDTDSGSATPTLGIINLLGTSAQGISSSGAGDTVTLTVADATESQKGVVELATSTEATTGTDTSRAIVATGLKAKLGAQTSHGIALGTGDTTAIGWTAEPSNGQLLIGSTGNAPQLGTLTAGCGIGIANAAGSITISACGGGVTWNIVPGTSQAAAINNGYITANVALTTVTLPSTAAIGSIIEVCGEGAGMWTIAQNAGQSIQFGNQVTTTGVGGSISATNRYDTIKLLCRVANTTFHVLSNVGILNLV